MSCSTPSDDSDEASDTAAGGFVNPYPLEGQYKDKADRERYGLVGVRGRTDETEF